MQKVGKIIKKSNEKYPEKLKARRAVSYAIKKGRLIKEPCTCGETRVDAHHEDYSSPLSVIWLCRLHHSEIHKRKT